MPYEEGAPSQKSARSTSTASASTFSKELKIAGATHRVLTAACATRWVASASARPTWWAAAATAVHLEPTASGPEAADHVTATELVPWTTSATPRPASANAGPTLTVDSVTNASPATGTTPTASVVTATATLTHVTQGQATASSAETSRQDPTATGARLVSTETLAMEWTSLAAHVHAQALRIAVSTMLLVATWTHALATLSVTARKDT